MVNRFAAHFRLGKPVNDIQNLRNLLIGQGTTGTALQAGSPSLGGVTAPIMPGLLPPNTPTAALGGVNTTPAQLDGSLARHLKALPVGSLGGKYPVTSFNAAGSSDHVVTARGGPFLGGLRFGFDITETSGALVVAAASAIVDRLTGFRLPDGEQILTIDGGAINHVVLLAAALKKAIGAASSQVFQDTSVAVTATKYNAYWNMMVPLQAQTMLLHHDTLIPSSVYGATASSINVQATGDTGDTRDAYYLYARKITNRTRFVASKLDAWGLFTDNVEWSTIMDTVIMDGGGLSKTQLIDLEDRSVEMMLGAGPAGVANAALANIPVKNPFSGNNTYPIVGTTRGGNVDVTLNTPTTLYAVILSQERPQVAFS